MDEWIRCREMIDSIANDYALFMEKSRLMFRRMETNSITEYRISILMMQHKLNEKLLRYHELIERLQYKDKDDQDALESFYAYVYQGMNERVDEINSFLTLIENMIKQYVQFEEFSADNRILNDAISCVKRNSDNMN